MSPADHTIERLVLAAIHATRGQTSWVALAQGLRGVLPDPALELYLLAYTCGMAAGCAHLQDRSEVAELRTLYGPWQLPEELVLPAAVPTQPFDYLVAYCLALMVGERAELALAPELRSHPLLQRRDLMKEYVAGFRCAVWLWGAAGTQTAPWPVPAAFICPQCQGFFLGGGGALCHSCH